MTSDVSTYRIGRQRIVQTDLHDHAMNDGDERTLCGKYGAKAVVLQHELAFVPYADHACGACSELVGAS
ncbi:MAG: hypothetical protein KDB10_23075 [Acidimicrobiales bacterium]|nr:hypothetical protein [Acidimicrobiales bacterium]